jgi:hypothetical protein
MSMFQLFQSFHRCAPFQTLQMQGAFKVQVLSALPREVPRPFGGLHRETSKLTILLATGF